ELGGQLVAMQALGRPRAWQLAQLTAVNALKVFPYWDPVLSASGQENDPADVLAARSALLYWPRTGGSVGVSDIISGAAGTVTLTHFEDSLRASIGSPPLGTVTVTMEAQWTQRASDEGDLAPQIANEFGENYINTLTPDDFQARWQVNGSDMGAGSGYTVLKSSLTPNTNPGLMRPLTSDPVTVQTALYPSNDPAKDTRTTRVVEYPRTWFDAELTVRAEYSQARKEVVGLSVTSDLQPYAPDPQPIEYVSLRTQDLTVDDATPQWAPRTLYEAGSFVIYSFFRWQATKSFTSGPLFNNDLALGLWQQVPTLGCALPSFGSPNYFDTQRGVQTIENAVLRARAILAKSARCVRIQVEVPLSYALAYTIDHNAIVVDDRLPGGTATGKITGLEFDYDGDGKESCSVTVECCIGNGQVVQPGTDQIEVENTVYGIVAGALIVPVQTQPFDVQDLLLSVDVANEPDDQVSAVQTAANSTQKVDIDAVLAANPTSVTLNMQSLASYPTLTRELAVDAIWYAPKGISLTTTGPRILNEDGTGILLETGGSLLLE
ncbi:MAG TPA: hypothetical protein VKT80_13710, partial [Chloroflexota bacterium]|nr:hypothetical protein [Chloroflexota bacterium]